MMGPRLTEGIPLEASWSEMHYSNSVGMARDVLIYIHTHSHTAIHTSKEGVLNGAWEVCHLEQGFSSALHP